MLNAAVVNSFLIYKYLSGIITLSSVRKVIDSTWIKRKLLKYRIFQGKSLIIFLFFRFLVIFDGLDLKFLVTSHI